MDSISWKISWLQRSSVRPMFLRGNKPLNIASHWSFFPLLFIVIFVQGCVSVGTLPIMGALTWWTKSLLAKMPKTTLGTRYQAQAMLMVTA